MAAEAETKPLGGDDVPRIDNAVAVGEDLDFQRRWWRFEKLIWGLFIVILLADLSGLLGRGPLANAEAQTSDHSLRIKYERVQRESTASILTILPSPAAVRGGDLHLFVSDSVVKQLGAQRIIPQPKTSVVGSGGVLYDFPVSGMPVVIQFELKPSFIGSHRFAIGTAQGERIERSTLVLP